MASIVTINASTTQLSLNPGDPAALAFDVANAADRPVTVKAQMVGATAQVPDPGWLRVEGEAQFTLAPSETRQVTVTGTPPEGASRVALEVFETALPEENVDRSAPIEITAGAAASTGGKGWVLPVVIAAVVLVLAIGGGVAWWMLRDPGLPDVAGLSQADAIAALEERDYTAREIVPLVAQDETPGTVLSAEIVPGTENDDPPLVRLEVAMSGLPDVAGLEADAARDALLAAGAGDAIIKLVPARVNRAGQVIRQSPAPLSAFDANTVVSLEVGGIQVPDVKGQNFNAANSALRNAGLVLGNQRETDDANARRGTILGSDPRAGTLVAGGSVIDILVDNRDPVVTPPTPPVQPPSRLNEDCLAVRPDDLEITQTSSGFRVGERGRSRFMFPSEEVAKRTIYVLQKYDIDEICYVERPQPPMMYLKSRGKAPSGELRDERCFRFSPRNLDIQQRGSQHLLLNAGATFRFDSIEAAKGAWEIIDTYGMTHLCANGPEFSKFHYFRR